MTDRASIFETVQIGVETTPGVAVPALKKLQSLGIEPAARIETKSFRAMGNKFPSLVVPGKEWVTARLSGLATYTEIIYALASVLGYTVPVQQGGTAAYQWVHAPHVSSPDTVKTFTVEQGSYLRAHRFTNGLVTAFGVKYSREAIELSGEMLGRSLEDKIHLSQNAKYTLTAGGSPPTAGDFTLTFGGQTTVNIAYNATPAQVQAALEALSTIGAGNVEVTATVAEGAGNLSVAGNVYTIEFVKDLAQAPQTLTGTFSGLTPPASITLASAVAGAAPNSVDLVPVLPTEIDIYLTDAYSELATAEPLSRVLSVEWNISDRYGPLFPLRSSYGVGFASTVEIEPTLEAKIVMEADEEGMALLNIARKGDTKFMRIEAVGEAIEDPYFYLFRTDLALKVSEVGDFSDEDGVYAIEWTLTGVKDPVWGKAIEVTVVNNVSAL